MIEFIRWLIFVKIVSPGVKRLKKIVIKKIAITKIVIIKKIVIIEKDYND